jgi:hypothetical protein
LEWGCHDLIQGTVMVLLETGRKITNCSELLSVIQPTLQQNKSYRAMLLFQIARSLTTETASLNKLRQNPKHDIQN